MRIAFVGQKGYPATWGGVEVHVDAIARRLAHRGHEVTAFVRRWYDEENRPRVAGVQRVTLPTIRGKHLDASIHSAIAACHATAAGFDIVHFHALGPALFAGIPRLGGVGVVTTIHGLDYARQKWGGAAKLALRAGEISAFAASDRVVVVAEDLARSYSRRSRDVTLVANGVEEPPDSVSSAILDDLGLRGRSYFVSIGRWDPGKRVTELVRAFTQAGGSDAVLVVAGQADNAGYQREVRAASGGSRRIVFPGIVTGDAKWSLLRHADGFFTASDHEGLPIALLEALASGTRAWATNIAGHREVAGNIPGVELFSVGNEADAIAFACAAAVRHVPEAVSAVAERYSWEKSVDRLESIYREVMER